MCRPATDPPTPGWGYGYGQGWINTTRTRTLLYPGGTGTRVQQPVTIPSRKQMQPNKNEHFTSTTVSKTLGLGTTEYVHIILSGYSSWIAVPHVYHE